MDTTHIADQVLTASTALAGLLLVSLGAVASAYESYDEEGKAAVRAHFRRRGRFAFGGFAISLLSALCVLVFYWHQSEWLIDASTVLLLAALGSTLIAAHFSLTDIS